jgi:hypothetical protein
MGWKQGKRINTIFPYGWGAGRRGAIYQGFRNIMILKNKTLILKGLQGGALPPAG